MHGSQCLRQGGLPGLSGSGALAFPAIFKAYNAKATLKVIGTQVRLQDTLGRLCPARKPHPGSSLKLSP